MAKLEKFTLEHCPQDLKQILFCWKRFIDDIFLIFCGAYEELDRFHEYFNSVHPTMKIDKYEHVPETIHAISLILLSELKMIE